MRLRIRIANVGVVLDMSELELLRALSYGGGDRYTPRPETVLQVEAIAETPTFQHRAGSLRELVTVPERDDE